MVMKRLLVPMLDLMCISENDLWIRLEKAGFDRNKPLRTEEGMAGNWYIQEEQQMMTLKDFLNLQAGLDRVIMDRFESTGNTIDKRELLTDKILALMVETGEFTNELGNFKYWKQGHKADMDKVLIEFADIFFFYLSIANLLGFTAEQLQEAYMAKWNENIRRQKNNY